MIGGKLRGIFERCQSLAFVVEPAGRICDLLESAPKIESRESDFTLELRDAAAADAALRTVSDAGYTTAPLGDVPAGRKLLGVVSAGAAVRLAAKPALAELR